MARLKADENIAVDEDGRVLPYESAEVTSKIREMLADGDLLAVVLRGKDGNVAVQVFGPPSRELEQALTTAARAYRRVLRGH